LLGLLFDQHFLPKYWLNFTGLHGVTLQKMKICIVAAVGTSDPTILLVKKTVGDRTSIFLVSVKDYEIYLSLALI
jgi:hypothetical protein